MKYPSIDILISPLDAKARESLDEIKTYLEIHGDSYSQHSDNIDYPCRKEYHYFMGTSTVMVKTFKDKANIKILSLGEPYLSNIKKDIEKMLE